jgi:phage protein D
MSVKYEKLWDDYEHFDAPSAEFKIGGKDLAAVEDCAVAEAVVTVSCGNEANCAAVTVTTEFHENGLKPILQIGAKAEISFGYSKKLKPVFCGYLHELTVIKDETGITYRLLCLDCKGLMPLGSFAKRAEKDKLSKVIKGMLADSRYKPFYSKETVGAIPAAFDLPAAVMGESDYAFLCRWADLLGFYFYLDADKLFFTSDENAPKAPELELEQEYGVVSSEITASLSNQVKKVTLVSFDDDGKRVMVSETVPGVKGIAKDKAGSVLGAEKTFLYPAFREKSQLEYLKKARVKEIHREYCRLDAVCIGLPELAPLGKLKFEGQSFRITQAVHRFNQQTGYKTEISAFAE